MSHQSAQHEDVAFDALDTVLGHHFNIPAEQLAPSSGFTLSVIDAIHQHAIVPPPIPFPWKRALFGLTTAIGALIAFLVYIAQSHTFSSTSTLGPTGPPFSINSTQIAIGLILIAIALTAVALMASFRLAGRSH